MNTFPIYDDTMSCVLEDTLFILDLMGLEAFLVRIYLIWEKELRIDEMKAMLCI